MQKQEESYYKMLENFAYQKWFVVMAKILFLIKQREKLARHASQIQFVLELADKLKPDCLFKTSVFWPYASKLITLIVFVIESVLTSGHSTIPRKKYHPDNLMLRFRYFEESNI